MKILYRVYSCIEYSKEENAEKFLVFQFLILSCLNLLYVRVRARKSFDAHPHEKIREVLDYIKCIQLLIHSKLLTFNLITPSTCPSSLIDAYLCAHKEYGQPEGRYEKLISLVNIIKTDFNQLHHCVRSIKWSKSALKPIVNFRDFSQKIMSRSRVEGKPIIDSLLNYNSIIDFLS